MTIEPSIEQAARNRALAYLRRHGTQNDAEAIRQRLVKTFGQLEGLLQTTPEASRGTRPGQGRWSVQEVLDHLVLSNEPAVEQLHQMLAGTSPTQAIPADLQSEDPLAGDWQQLVSRLLRTHADFLAAFDKAANRDDSEPQPATGPVQMVLELDDGQRLEWIECLDWKAFVLAQQVHSFEHVRQIQRTLQAAAV